MTEKVSEKRKEQLREAQRRKRFRLSEGGRRQINIFLSPNAIENLDSLADKNGFDRHTMLEILLTQFSLNTIKSD